MKEREQPVEFYEKPVLKPPAVELFSDPKRTAEFWPTEIANDPEFLSQLESRKELNDRLDAAIAHLPQPDVSLDEAVAKKMITEEQAADLYASLSSLLEDGPDYRRIVLYLPFEFLPSELEQPGSEDLERSADRFRTAYMSAWRGLLRTQDVRANFVDGNVLDFKSRTGDLPRVVKAAHLIPKLVEKGFLKIDEVFDLMEKSKDETLRRSIAETLPVLFDMGFVDEAELGRVGASSVIKKETPPVEIALSSIQERLNGDFAAIDKEEYGAVTEKRKKWLRQDAKRQAIMTVSEKIAETIEKHAPTDEALAQFISPEAGSESQQALIEGARSAIEKIAHDNALAAKELYAKYSATFLALWDKNIPELRDALSKTFCRLNALGVVDDGLLRSFDISLPKLAGPFSENMKESDLADVKELIALIEKDPMLSRAVYPASLVFGSRLKGYGARNADIDMAILIKPGTDPAEAEKIRELLAATEAHKKMHGEIVEFWLEKTADGLAVRDEGVDGPFIGGSSWTHVLFGAAWEGDGKTIDELREKLLVPYFYDDKEKTIDGRAARGLYLEELERDNLQYRLMHKGYERYEPAYGGMNTPHSDGIDGKSAFWDSGYRRTATKLFASRVFLPKLER